jgi:hypothetical protein
MNPEEETELRRRFAALRREDAAATPSYATTTARMRRRRSRPGLTLALRVAAVCALVVVGVLLLRPGRPGVQVDLAATRYRGPTDFLLALPGDRALQAMPRLGEVPTDWRIP